MPRNVPLPAGQLLRQRVRGRRPSRQPGGASPRETAAQGQSGHTEEGRCQALGAAQVRPRVQGRREKPLTSLLPDQPLPEMFAFEPPRGGAAAAALALWPVLSAPPVGSVSWWLPVTLAVV